MKLLVDMNLSPAWVASLQADGWDATHWGTLGNPRSPDTEIMRFALEHGWTIFTNDLDFGALLAHTRAGKPSVFQVRARDVSPGHLAPLVFQSLRQFSAELESGALLP